MEILVPYLGVKGILTPILDLGVHPAPDQLADGRKVGVKTQESKVTHGI